MNTRRKLLVALSAGALVAPLASFGQPQGKVWRVGFLSGRSRPVSLDSDIFGAFSNGMRELGYLEGRNLVIEWRFAEGMYERLAVKRPAGRRGVGSTELTAASCSKEERLV